MCSLQIHYRDSLQLCNKLSVPGEHHHLKWSGFDAGFSEHLGTG